MIATSGSVVLCLLYLWFFPFTVAGMAASIGLGTLAMMLLGQRDGIVTTGITTVVIMVVAALVRGRCLASADIAARRRDCWDRDRRCIQWLCRMPSCGFSKGYAFNCRDDHEC